MNRTVRIVLVGLGGPCQLFHRATDRGERVADFMRQRRAQRRNRLEPLGPEIQLLDPLQVGDLGENSGDRRTPIGVAIEGRGAQADGKHPSIVMLHGPLAAAHLTAMADRRHHRRPHLR